MGTILIIIVAFGGICGLWALFASDKSDPKERAAEAAGMAAGGAMMAGSCFLQLVVAGLAALAGLWVLSKIFGH